MLLNCGNYFTESRLNNVIEALERGCEVRIYIDCIGHARNNYEQENYRRALVNKYGRKLNIKLHEGVCSYSYEYLLKKENDEQ